MASPQPETPSVDNDAVPYQALADWQALSLPELEEAYALIPTQRQQYYMEVLKREAAKVQAATDAEEWQVAQALLARFAQDALVPVGARWAKPPQRVQVAAMSGQPLTTPEDDYLPKNAGWPHPVLLIVAVILLCSCGVGIILLTRGGDAPETRLAADQAETTPTPRYTTTPTPIALEEQDTIIKDGDRDRSRTLAYPVGLHIYPPGEQQPRVWVVQRRAVEYSEWQYDPNPDTASYLLGMSVRRVVGIPWSDDNAALFARLEAGAVFHLILNTGAVIEYRFERQIAVRRSDTAAFRQIAPGLVLVLMGELDAEGAPPATRRLVMARYVPELELTRPGYLTDAASQPSVSPTPLPPTATSIPARDLLYVELVSAASSPDGYLITQLRLYNAQFEAVTLYPDDLQIAFGHQRNPPGPWTPATGFEALVILPGQALDLALVWKRESPYAGLKVLQYHFSIE